MNKKNLRLVRIWKSLCLNDDRAASASASEVNIRDRESPDGDFASFGTNETKVATRLIPILFKLRIPDQQRKSESIASLLIHE